MKYLSILTILISAGVTAGNYENSPLNYNNSPLNYENSELNYNNSPLNYDNSSLNYNSANGIYNEQGERQGYAVEKPSGGVNYFDNEGNRVGYGQ